MGTNKGILEKQIFDLEAEVKLLKEKHKSIYIHEAHTFWVDNGELHIECDQGSVVWNLESLYNDLPHLLSYCIEEHKENDKRIKKQMSEIINKNK